MTEKALEQLQRIADRLERVAQELSLAATVSEHRKSGLIGYLRSESSLIKEAIK